MNFGELFVSVLRQLPMLLIEVVGIVIAIVRWKRHPLASLLFVIGATIRLFVSLAYAVLPTLLRDTGMGNMMPIFTGLGVVGGIGLALLVAAVFVERPVEPIAGLGYGTKP